MVFGLIGMALFSMLVGFHSASADTQSLSTTLFSSTNAATQATINYATGYDYKIVSNVVVDGSNNNKYVGADFSAALNWAMGQEDKVTYVPAGNYNVHSSIYIAQGATLYGDGQGTTGTVINFSDSTAYAEAFVIYDVSDVTLSNFRMTGYGTIYAYAYHTDISKLTFDRITAYRCGGNDFEFALLAYSSHKVDGVTFTNCIADGPDGWGFVLSGDDSGLKTNIKFIDCTANYCGSYSTRFNEWGVGFDLVEMGAVSNILLDHCTASYNWESGFHLEWNKSVTNMTLIDCVANYNGQKPNNNDNGDGTIGPQYAEGYLVFAGEEVKLQNCSGTGNTLGLVYFNLKGTVISNWDNGVHDIQLVFSLAVRLALILFVMLLSLYLVITAVRYMNLPV
jgi:hypothetical protein